jgi:hypothetical protein
LIVQGRGNGVKIGSSGSKDVKKSGSGDNLITAEFMKVSSDQSCLISLGT